ncbi:hypothetical protein NW752_003143 [Fusarium irregulare]|nr:hypothetical protein NW752_003143 [Fusarium irregulare]
MTRAAGRPSTSCNVCKRQKIRCSGERPSCNRCVRLKTSCHYANNGVRKRKEQPRSFTENRSSSYSAPPIVAAPCRSIEDTLDDIPATLLTTLVDLYFANVYQSTLLFHKPTFLQSLFRGTVRQHVLLSICAWGANFYRDEYGKVAFKDQGLMTKWAKKAGALVFQDAEDLNEDNIETHVNFFTSSAQQIYARCIHDVHNRNPPTISNEPKYADASAFVDFGVDADLAKASILEFTGILRAGNGGYLKPGEESHDLTIKSTSPQTTAQSDEAVTDLSESMQPSGLSELAHVSQPYLLEPGGSEWPTFDVFNSLLDADITTLMPIDDNLDLSVFDFNFSTSG